MNSISGRVQSGLGGAKDFGLALGVIAILMVLFTPVPAVLIDFGLALSIACAVLILMAALWIDRPLEFSAFPSILLILTMLRLALNVATTRLILTEGGSGHAAAGYVIAGFANLVMAGDFVIGLIVFLILLTVNFIVITKGASRIAEVGARFALDGVPGKQMAIDADLAAGVIDEADAQRRRFELEEESAFFGAMDGASKFVRGDAIAGLIISGINIVGGVAIASVRHGMPLSDAIDIYTKLSVGDGVVSQIPALIVSLAAGLVVAKGGARGATQSAIVAQLGGRPKALAITALLMSGLALVPALPFLPFALFALVSAAAGYLTSRRLKVEVAKVEKDREERQGKSSEPKVSLLEELRINALEVAIGRQLAVSFLRRRDELSHRAGKLRRNFALKYGFVLPEINLCDELSLPPRVYQIRIHGNTIANFEIPTNDVLVVVGEGPRPALEGRETREPSFGLKAMWVSEACSHELEQSGFTPIDSMTIILTHLGECMRNNLAQLFSYRDTQRLLDALQPEYKRLLEEVRPAHISTSGIQGVLKLLLVERVSIRNFPLILEAIAECAPLVRRVDHLVEHVRQRLGQQICSDLAGNGVLGVLRLGARWEIAFNEALRRDQRREIIEFDIDPRLIDEFKSEASAIIQRLIDQGELFAVVTTVDARPYVRLLLERIFPMLPILSHVEIARGVQVKYVGSIG